MHAVHPLCVLCLMPLVVKGVRISASNIETSAWKKGGKKPHFGIDPNAANVSTCADVLINLFMRRTECSHCVNWHIYAFSCGGEKSVPVFHCKGLGGGWGGVLSPQRGNYCIYDHTKTHALREGGKWVSCSEQGCSALLKGTSVVLWKCPGSSPATSPLFSAFGLQPGMWTCDPQPSGQTEPLLPQQGNKVCVWRSIKVNIKCFKEPMIQQRKPLKLLLNWHRIASTMINI